MLWINCEMRLDSVGMRKNNPVVEYQSESFRMFNDMIGSIEFDVTRLVMKAQIHEQERPRTEHSISTTATRNIAAQQQDIPADIDLSQSETQRFVSLWFR